MINCGLRNGISGREAQPFSRSSGTAKAVPLPGTTLLLSVALTFVLSGCSE